MAEIHAIKLTQDEAVVKIYKTDANGGVVDLDLSTDIKLDSETFNRAQANVAIAEIFWGAKKDKQIDISRIDDPVANTVHGHYYLINTGSYNFDGFVDNVYGNSDIRITADGPFHVLLKLRKTSGYA